MLCIMYIYDKAFAISNTKVLFLSRQFFIYGLATLSSLKRSLHHLSSGYKWYLSSYIRTLVKFYDWKANDFEHRNAQIQTNKKQQNVFVYNCVSPFFLTCFSTWFVKQYWCPTKRPYFHVWVSMAKSFLSDYFSFDCSLRVHASHW